MLNFSVATRFPSTNTPNEPESTFCPLPVSARQMPAIATNIAPTDLRQPLLCTSDPPFRLSGQPAAHDFYYLAHSFPGAVHTQISLHITLPPRLIQLAELVLIHGQRALPAIAATSRPEFVYAGVEENGQGP